MEIYNLISFAGIFIFMGIAYGLSENRQKINYRVLLWGILFQLIFASFIFIFPAGAKVFLWINDLVVAVLNASQAGTKFLFGRLALPPGTENEFGESSMGFFLAFQALPTIIFFSALTSLLYYAKVLPVVIKYFSRIFTKAMRISGAESLCSTANIFVGVESFLLIKPHLKNLTRSELTVVLTAGMATVASNVMGIYIFSLQEIFPTIAGHLVAASFLSVPASIIMAKLLVPETENPETLGLNVEPSYEREDNFFEAIINGANTGVRLIVGIGALLLAVLGIVALLDLILQSIGGLINMGDEMNLRNLFGYAAYPFVIAMGVPFEDALRIAGIVGERLILTEVTSYMDLAVAMREEMIVHPRSAVIAAYALCGFAHFASLSIFIGGMVGLIPERKADIAKMGFKALIAATLATFMTGAIAGTFYMKGSSILLF